MIPNPRLGRAWDPCVVIDLLEGTSRAETHVRSIAERARRGETHIWVSAFAMVEVARIQGRPDDAAERIIREFFAQEYVVVANLDPFVAEIARALVRDLRIKGKDAVHLATAIRWNVPVFETFDIELLRRVSNSRSPLPGGLDVREPRFNGQPNLFQEADGT